MKLPTVAISLSLLLAGCSASPIFDPVVISDPTEPTLAVAPPEYQSVLGGFRARRPQAPADWRQLNDDLSPAKPGGNS